MQEKLLKRVDELIKQGEMVLGTRSRSSNIHIKGEYVDNGLFAGFRTACLSFLQKLFSSNHIYYSEFNKKVGHPDPNCVENGINTLKSVRKEIEDGWIFELKDLVSAEIFKDFIEMAEHFLSKGYKDPAAVIVGGVLEEHLIPDFPSKSLKKSENLIV